MKRLLKHSLKVRLIFAFSTFAVLLSLLYWVLSIGFMSLSEDSIFNRQLTNEVSRQKLYYSERQSFVQPPLEMQLFVGEQVRDFVYAEDIIDEPLGIFELEDQNYHIAKDTIAPGGPVFYITYFIANQEVDDATYWRLSEIFFYVFLIVASTGVALGFFVGGRTAAPIIKLDKRVQQLSERDTFGDVSVYGEDEVGRLASSLAESYRRSHQFLEREQRFTREVSHELRTPTAVISGALDILELQPDNSAALARIRRASTQMQQLIETFLLLGREESTRLSDSVLDAVAVCRNSIAQQREHSRVTIELQCKHAPQLRVLAPVFAVLLDNLLANAVRHTERGGIDVLLDTDSLRVRDTGCGFPPEMLAQIGKPYLEGSFGQGLGLSIVGRICQQFSWQLKIESA
ncbi:MAG: sensor histidine kinase, partial [Pseudomonadales bacterium]